MTDPILHFTMNANAGAAQSYVPLGWPLYQYPQPQPQQTFSTFTLIPPLTKEDVREVICEEFLSSQKREFKLIGLVEQFRLLLGQLDFNQSSTYEDFVRIVEDFNQELDRILARSESEKEAEEILSSEQTPVPVETGDLA